MRCGYRARGREKEPLDGRESDYDARRLGGCGRRGREDNPHRTAERTSPPRMVDTASIHYGTLNRQTEAYISQTPTSDHKHSFTYDLFCFLPRPDR